MVQRYFLLPRLICPVVWMAAMPALPSAPGTCSMRAHHQTIIPGAVEEKPFTSSVNICPPPLHPLCFPADSWKFHLKTT